MPKINRRNNVGNLIHNINSDLMSLHQAFEMIRDNLSNDTVLVNKVLELSQAKFASLEESWEKLKEQIR